MASAIAVVYNLFSSKPLPWIYKQKVIPIVHDTELLSLSGHDKETNTEATDTTVIEDTLQTKTSDTITTETKQDTIEQELLSDKKSTIESEKENYDETQEKKLKTLNYNQVLKIINNPDFILIDARHPEEWEKEHIGNAINIEPPYEGDIDSYFKKLMAVPQNKILVVYCTGGSCDASHKVASDLMSLGYTRVYLYSGGWDDWIKKGKGK